MQKLRTIDKAFDEIKARDLTTYVLERMLVILLCLEVILYCRT